MTTLVNERTTSSNERIIPIRIEGINSSSNSSDDETRQQRPQKVSVVVRSEENPTSNSKEVKFPLVITNKLDDSRHNTMDKDNNKKQKLSNKQNISKESVKSSRKKSKEGKHDSNNNPNESAFKKNSKQSKLENTVITVQPGKSILKHPVATSTPIPGELHETSSNTSTVVRKEASKKSKCRSWCCFPFGLCCVCEPFECECCDCCYLKCYRCQQCLCQCCNQKCC